MIIFPSGSSYPHLQSEPESVNTWTESYRNRMVEMGHVPRSGCLDAGSLLGHHPGKVIVAQMRCPPGDAVNASGTSLSLPGCSWRAGARGKTLFA